MIAELADKLKPLNEIWTSGMFFGIVVGAFSFYSFRARWQFVRYVVLLACATLGLGIAYLPFDFTDPVTAGSWSELPIYMRSSIVSHLVPLASLLIGTTFGYVAATKRRSIHAH